MIQATEWDIIFTSDKSKSIPKIYKQTHTTPFGQRRSDLTMQGGWIDIFQRLKHKCM